MEKASDSMHTNQYSLSIRFSSDGFSLSVNDENDALISSKKISASLFSLSEKDISLLLTKETETKLVFRSIRLICNLDNYTFVPEPLFSPAEASDLLYFQKKTEKNEHVLYNNVPSWNMVNIFSIPVELQKAISNIFPESAIEHHLSYLVTEQIKTRTGSSLHIFVRSKIMDTVVISKGVLTLVNSFVYTTPEDFTYYTLNLFEQLALDTENCGVYLYSQDKMTEYINNLQKYIKSCESIKI